MEHFQRKGQQMAPIVFTSNVTTPAPGNWRGIYFCSGTLDSASILIIVLLSMAGE